MNAHVNNGYIRPMTEDGMRIARAVMNYTVKAFNSYISMTLYQVVKMNTIRSFF